MKLKLVSILLICLMTSSVFASYFWQQTDETSPQYSATDNWTEPNQWSTVSGTPSGTDFSGMPAPPSPAGGEIKLTTNTWMSGTAHCTVNSLIGSYTGVNISVNGNLYIDDGANIGFNRSGDGYGLRVGSTTAGGTSPQTGTVNQSGGTVGATNMYLGYGGDTGAGTGNYIISGGSLTCSTSLTVGGGKNTTRKQQTVGKFTVNGNSSTISVTALGVGGTDVTDTTNSGTLEFLIVTSGVSAIGCTSVSLDAGGNNATTALIVSATGTPSGNILLVNNTGTAVTGSFDTLNSGSAIEGATVTLGSNTYTLTYMYDSVSGTVGTERSATYNDIALIPGGTPGITISTPDTNTGDLLIAAVATDGDTSSSITAPDGEGWTLIDRDASSGGKVTLGAWWKLADASEAVSHTFTWTGTQQAYGWMMRFTGHNNSTNPITSAPGNDLDSTPTSPTVTSTVDNCIILRLGAFDNNDITVNVTGLPSSDHTDITMDESGGIAGGTVSGGAGYAKQSTAGSSGTADFSLGTANEASMITVAIAPADSNSANCCGGLIKP